MPLANDMFVPATCPSRGGSVRLGLDVGGVISVMGCKADGDLIYQGVDPDFTTFSLMYHQHHGLSKLSVISRTKKAKIKAVITGATLNTSVSVSAKQLAWLT